MKTESIGATEAAFLLRDALEQRDWRFSLTQAGDLFVTIGDTPPQLTQAQTLALIQVLEQQFLAMLNGSTH